MRWLAGRDGCPLHWEVKGGSDRIADWGWRWWWTSYGCIDFSFRRARLPLSVWQVLLCQCKEWSDENIWIAAGATRQEAEEAAVLAWEAYRKDHPEEPLC